MSIRFVADKYANFKHLLIKDKVFGKLPPGLENLCCELYNGYVNENGISVMGKEEITLTSTHPEWRKMNFFGLPAGFWRVLKCKPGEWVFLPHGQYAMSVPSGAEKIVCIMNFGEAMFKGNKLPSRPEAKKDNFFQTDPN